MRDHPRDERRRPVTDRPVTDSAPVVVDDTAASRFEVLVDGAVAGYAEYRRTASALSFTHTVVDPAFEGRGLGSVLARGALDAAREAGARVLPFCPFIRGYIRRHPDDLDLVPADRRAQFGLAPAADHPIPDDPR
ncbi:GNAT family N-acetyltransferase [Geodermatophilus sp. SYSU D01036]